MIYHQFDVPPPTLHNARQLKAGVEVRIQDRKRGWVLVAVLGKDRFRCLEGWINGQVLTPVSSS